MKLKKRSRPGFERPRPARSLEDRGLPLGLDRDPSPPVVFPGRREIERLAQIEVRVERARIVLRPERDLHSRVDVPEPEGVLVLRPVPGPGEIGRPQTALPAQPHHVLGDRGGHRDLEIDVLDLGLFRSAQADRELEEAVHLHRRLDGCADRAAAALRGPGDAPGRARDDLRPRILPDEVRPLHRFHDEVERRGQDLAACPAGDAGYVRGEKAADLLRQSGLGQVDRTAQAAQGSMIGFQRRERDDDLVVGRERRIEPAEAGKTGGLVVARSGNGLRPLTRSERSTEPSGAFPWPGRRLFPGTRPAPRRSESERRTTGPGSCP